MANVSQNVYPTGHSIAPESLAPLPEDWATVPYSLTIGPDPDHPDYAACAWVEETTTGGGAARTTTTITTSVIAAGGQVMGSFALAKGTAIFVVRDLAHRQCRVRLYGTAAARTADVARAIETSAISGSYPAGTGLTLDVVLASNTSYTIEMDPKAIAGSPDDPPVTTVYYTVDNLTGDAVALQVELRHTPVEA